MPLWGMHPSVAVNIATSCNYNGSGKESNVRPNNVPARGRSHLGGAPLGVRLRTTRSTPVAEVSNLSPADCIYGPVL